MVWRGRITRKLLLEGEGLIFNRGVGNILKSGASQESSGKKIEARVVTLEETMMRERIINV